MKFEYECESLIISTGASAMYLGLPSEKEDLGKVFQLVPHVMDFFIEIKVAVIKKCTTSRRGLYLANICSKVYLVHSEMN